MNTDARVSPLRSDPKADLIPIVHIFLCFALLMGTGAQLYLEFATGAGEVSSTLATTQYTTLSYMVYWARLFPGLMLLFLAGFQLLAGSLFLSVIYGTAFLGHLVVIFVTDHDQVVQGLVYALGQ